MTNINEKIVSNDAHKSYCYNSDQTIHSAGDLLPLSNNASFLSLEDYYYSLAGEEQRISSTPNNENKCRIHLGTHPGALVKDGITFEQSQLEHSLIIDGVDSYLSSLDISYRFIKKDAFSYSPWGLEPYACIVFSCSDDMAKGVAAILGRTLRQEAIGIYSDNGDGDSHPIFTVSSSDNSLITQSDALELMKIINENYKGLSGQFDAHGQGIEFHDYDHKYNERTATKRLKTIIHEHFENRSFRVADSIGKSSLFESEDYEQAITQAGLTESISLTKLYHLHDYIHKKIHIY